MAGRTIYTSDEKAVRTFWAGPYFCTVSPAGAGYEWLIVYDPDAAAGDPTTDAEAVAWGTGYADSGIASDEAMRVLGHYVGSASAAGAFS